MVGKKKTNPEAQKCRQVLRITQLVKKQRQHVNPGLSDSWAYTLNEHINISCREDLTLMCSGQHNFSLQTNYSQGCLSCVEKENRTMGSQNWEGH